jgi:hypothetical protein
MEATVDPDNVTDQRMLFGTVGERLIYHSAPLDKDLVIAGFFRLSAWISIDQPDTDFQACVYLVNVDGSSILLAADTMRARYREGLHRACVLSTTEPLRYDFARFTFVARRLLAGARLRLTVGPLNSIFSQRNHNSGGSVSDETMDVARPVTVRLVHDQLRASALYVPFGKRK